MKKRPLSDWNKFVMAVKKQNPNMQFKDVLVLAGQLKKKGVTADQYAKNKTANVDKKVKKAKASSTKKSKKSVRKTGKRRQKK